MCIWSTWQMWPIVSYHIYSVLIPSTGWSLPTTCCLCEESQRRCQASPYSWSKSWCCKTSKGYWFSRWCAVMCRSVHYSAKCWMEQPVHYNIDTFAYGYAMLCSHCVRVPFWAMVMLEQSFIAGVGMSRGNFNRDLKSLGTALLCASSTDTKCGLAEYG